MSLSQKAKAWSLTHIVSLITIMASDISYNALFFYYLHPNFPIISLLWNAFVNFAYALGMYYYAGKVSATAQGITVEEQPQKQ